ncbi:FAD-dependent oxidoreductase [Nocardioides sp.]|uniref:NAD(P)/FAD-dependent oxidoreductase n=1 Tax=Nocardioides sp. TaxID=35761 RepID=UPI00262769D9|nr:FAD-dependent oxidoreductase [Nocardioides sp.]
MSEVTGPAAGTVGRILVVGGGIGGVSTLAALRAGGYDGELVLIDRAAFPYDRPPLSKAYLAGECDVEDLALQQPGWYAEHRIDLITDADVTAIDPEAGTVTVSRDGAVTTLTGDRIVLATGGRAIVPRIPGIDSPRVHVLRTFADADALRALLVPGARALIVGAGLIGAETASTARELGADVVLVDPVDPPIAAAVGPDLARWLHDQHAVAGVETVATTLEALQEGPTGIVAQLAGETGTEPGREFDVVLVGVGITPDTALAEAAGLEVDRGVLVDAGQVTSHPRVLAIGDIARLRDHGRTEHWEAAQRDGQRAAATLLGTAVPAAASLDAASWFWSDRYHRHVEGVGVMRAADAEHQVLRRGEPTVDEGPGFSLWTLTPTDAEGRVRVLGCAAVDDPNAVRAARRLIDRGTAVDPAQLADPNANLRALLRG